MSLISPCSFRKKTQTIFIDYLAQTYIKVFSYCSTVQYIYCCSEACIEARQGVTAVQLQLPGVECRLFAAVSRGRVQAVCCSIQGYTTGCLMQYPVVECRLSAAVSRGRVPAVCCSIQGESAGCLLQYPEVECRLCAAISRGRVPAVCLQHNCICNDHACGLNYLPKCTTLLLYTLLRFSSF